MVSLGDDNRRSGGYFFDEHAAESTMQMNQDSEELLDTTPLGTEDETNFRSICIWPALCFVILLSIGLEVAAFLVPDLCHADSCGVEARSIIIYSHIGLSMLLILVDRYLQRQHYQSRMRGYLDFYRRTRLIRHVPLAVYAAGNGVLLVFVTLFNEYCKPQCKPGTFTEANGLQLIISLETAVVLVVMVIYLVWAMQFNRRQACPDVQQDDMMAVFTHTHNHMTDVGFKDDGMLGDVLEKQADLILYLKQHNAHLAKKILNLQTQLRQTQKS